MTYFSSTPRIGNPGTKGRLHAGVTGVFPCRPAAVILGVLLQAGALSLLGQDDDVFLGRARQELATYFLFTQVGYFQFQKEQFAEADYSFRCLTFRKKVGRKSGRTKKERITQQLEVYQTGTALNYRITRYRPGKAPVKTERTFRTIILGPDAIELRDRIREMASLTFLREEMFHGVETRVYSFTMPDKVPKDLRRLAKTSGLLWFDAAEDQLVKVEGEYRGTVVLAHGGFASGVEYRKGTQWGWELQRMDQSWVPFTKVWRYPRRGHYIVDETECLDFKRLPQMR